MTEPTFQDMKRALAAHRAAEAGAASAADRQARDAENDQLQREADDRIARKRSDVVFAMQRAGKLTKVQVRAANEIQAIFQKITAGLGPKTSGFAQERVSGSGPSDDFPPSLRRAYVERYSLWRDEAGGKLIAQRLKKSLPLFTAMKLMHGKKTVADLVFAILIDNCGTEQVAKAWHMDGRRVLELFRESLHRYGEIGGWHEPTIATPPPVRFATFGHPATESATEMQMRA